MFNIVLFEPEIPPNTGNIIRLASNCGCNLHLIEPIAFSMDDKRLRRAGLDYHEFSTLKTHTCWEEFATTLNQSCRVFACTTKGATQHTSPNYLEGDYFIFGPETRGLPDEVLDSPLIKSRIRIPMLPSSRSLNLSNSVAIIAYEAWRQSEFKGAE